MHTPVITAAQLERGKRKPQAWKALWIALGVGIAATAIAFVQFMSDAAAADKDCAERVRLMFTLQHEATLEPRNMKLRQDAMRGRINAETACRVVAKGG